MTNLQLITTPFAENGTKNTIPEGGAAEPQLATMQAGFPEITQRPINEGGIPPERADFNGILNLYGQHLVHLNKGLPYEFDQDFANSIGGYPLNARVMLANGDIVQNTQDGNTNNPNLNMGGWKSFPTSNEINVLKADVLPATQTKDSFKNAYSPKRVDKFKKLRAMCATGRAYIWKNPTQTGASDYRFSIGVNMSGYRTSEWDFISDIDGFYRMKYGYTNSIRPPNITVDATNMSQTPIRVSDNAYFRSTDGLNASFDIVFNGQGFLFNHYVDSNGGVFEVKVDGVLVGNISTNASNPENSEAVAMNISKLIINGLPNGSHTASFKFIGNDPLYPPSSGTSRGWFKLSDGVEPEAYTAYVITGSEMGRAPTGSLLVSNGILEFAISATPTSSSFAADWVPAHGSKSGCIVVGERTIYIDNIKLDDALSTVSSEQEIKEFTMVQKYTAYNSSDTEKTLPMWEGEITTKFDRVSGLTYNHEFTTLNELSCLDGYTAMCSGQRKDSSGNTIFSKIETDNGYEIDVSAAPPATQINHNSGVLRSCMWLGSKTGLAITVENPEASSAMGQITNDGEATLLTERPDRFCKLYFKPMGTNKTIPSETVFTSSHSIWLATL